MPSPGKRSVLLAAGTAVTVVGAGLFTAVAASAAAGCRVGYVISNQWPGGFGAEVTVTNLGDPINGWRLLWSYTGGQTVTQAWNATVTQSGNQVTATNAEHNVTIAGNAAVSFGFNGSWTTGNPVPGTFTLNGTACTGSATPTSGPPSSPPPTTPPSTQPPTTPPSSAGRQMEDLNRGVISVRSGSGNLVSWRLLGTEAANTGFNVYRGTTK